MKLILFVVITLPFFGIAQDKGIKFESGLSWKKIKAKAQSENKYIFMDCYATWCGPCRYMSREIFSQKTVGDYFDSNFISVAVQMDERVQDPDDIKQWYADARMLEKEYFVDEYPTYLFFSPDGRAVHRMVGTTKDSKEFMNKVAEAFNPATQYYTLIDKYKEHEGDSVFLHNALSTALKAYDNINASAIADTYLACIQTPFSKENLILIARSIKFSKSQCFVFYLQHAATIDCIMGKDFAEIILRNIITKEEISQYYKTDATSPNWEVIFSKLNRKYPIALTARIIAESKVSYYELKKKWSEYEISVVSYMKQYGSELSMFAINSKAWGVFLNSNNPKILEAALSWSRRTLAAAVNGQPPYLDTYANLLYKTGNTSEAILWEKMAIQLSIAQNLPENRKSFEQVLGKMEKGEKTW